MAGNSEICKPGGPSGLFLPLTQAEQELEDTLRAVLYGSLMVYLFLGVSIVADIFVGSIEEVTSRRVKRQSISSGSVSTAKVWNDTVANLTLMALGSSAPEIFLSLIDLFRNDMMAGELGTFTIVGSASFNLFVIVAVCMVVIPAGDSRQIKEIPAFYITAIFSVFAYMWLVFILVIHSPDQVHIWEAVVTLAFQPALVWISYRADTADFSNNKWIFYLTGSHGPTAGAIAAARVTEGSNLIRAVSTYVPPSQAALGDDSPSGSALSSVISETNFAWRHSHAAAKHKVIMNVTRQSMRNSTSSMRHSTVSFRTSSASSRLPSIVANRSLHSVNSSSSHMSYLLGTSLQVQFLASVQHVSKDAMEKHLIVVRNGGTCAWVAMEVGYTVYRCQEAASRPAPLVVALPYQATQASYAAFARLLQSAREPQQVSAWRVSVDGTPVRGEMAVESQIIATKGTGAVVTGLLRGGEWVELADEEGFIRITNSHGVAVLDAMLRSYSGSVKFNIEDLHKEIVVQRGSNISWDDGSFIVMLDRIELENPMSTPRSNRSPPQGEEVQLTFGQNRTTEVHVALERSPGIVDFVGTSVKVKSKAEKQCLEVVVVRKEGCTGSVNCAYRTESFSAISGWDFDDAVGILEFPEGVTESTLEVQVSGKSTRRAACDFFIVLSDPRGGACLDADADGGDGESILTVHIPALGLGGRARRCDACLNFYSLRSSMEEWLDQIIGAPFVNGSREEQEQAECSDIIFHLVALPWKVMFVALPPARLLGGWPCFFACLLVIGGLTGVIADLAELFGCVLAIPNEVTAIVFVALGTSMPDLFASKTAAVEDPTADASIVNVTGSNSVNVFLGLGLPWTIGAIYWAIVGRSSLWEAQNPEMAERIEGVVFVVKAHNLGFNVLVFTMSCFGGLGLLLLRRRFLGLELGGPKVPKVACAVAFLLMWVGYITLTSWRALRWSRADFHEQVIMMASTGGVVSLGVLSAAVIVIVQGCQQAESTRNSWPVEATTVGVPEEKEEETSQGQQQGPHSVRRRVSGARASSSDRRTSSMSEDAVDSARRDVSRRCIEDTPKNRSWHQTRYQQAN